MTGSSSGDDGTDEPGSDSGFLSDGGNPGQRHAAPTVMVSSGRDDLTRSVPVELLADIVRPGDGVVVLTTCRSAERTPSRLREAVDPLDPGRVAVVDRAGGSHPDEFTVRTVDPDADPETVSAAVESGIAALDADCGGRIHLLVDAIHAPRGEATAERPYDCAHEVAMTVGAKPGAALVAVDESDFSSDFLDRLTHLFDVHLRLREHDGRREARWTGLTGGSGGWRPWSEVEFRRSRPM